MPGGVDEGEDIAAEAIADALYGIAGEQFHGGGRDALRAACFAGLAQWLAPSTAIQAERILLGSRATMRPIVETLERGDLWVWHQVLMNTTKGVFRGSDSTRASGEFRTPVHAGRPLSGSVLVLASTVSGLSGCRWHR